ncbi:MAG: nucleotide pyrophosphohydrolase [Planctomycetaceae bacterium]
MPKPAHDTKQGRGQAGWEPLLELLRTFRDDRDWKQFHHPKDLAAAIAIEAGELQELFLWKKNDEVEADLAEPSRRRAVVDELADVLICTLLLADRLGIDIDTAVREKTAANARKYPVSRARGTARKYTELRDPPS